MPTLVQTATRWAAEQAAHRGRPVAIQFNAATIGVCAVGNDVDPTGHGYGTAAVNLMQARPAAGGWLALSYQPTAACIGMALLMGFTRIVWQHAGTARGLKVTRAGTTEEHGAAAIQIQADRTVYAGDHANPAAFNYVVPGPFASAHFVPPAGTNDIIQTLGGDDEVKDAIGVRLAFMIVGMGFGGNRNNPLRAADQQGQNIASVLVDAAYNIVAWGLNTNTGNSTLHGEVNLVRAFQISAHGAQLPAGGRLFTTLEPCAMCSGMIMHTSGDGPLTVVSGQEDPHLTYTALRAWHPWDGYSGVQRRVTHEFTRSNFHAAKSTFHEGQTATTTRRYLEQTQRQRSGDDRIMQTTRFLEQHAADALVDHTKILSMQAAVWLPAHRRAAWRAKLLAFALHVRDSIR